MGGWGELFFGRQENAILSSLWGGFGFRENDVIFYSPLSTSRQVSLVVVSSPLGLWSAVGRLREGRCWLDFQASSVIVES
jgi:hypothetical protein